MKQNKIYENILKSKIKNIINLEVQKILQWEELERTKPAREEQAKWDREEEERIAHNKRVDAQYAGNSGGQVYDWGRHNRELHTHGFRKGY